MKKTIFIFSLIVMLSIISINLINASLADVQYPVAELGNCNSQAECEAYCDNVENIEVCLTQAEKYGLMTADEIAEARKFMPFIKSGNTPGGCKGQKECDEYCNKDENLIECIEFAKEAGIISQEEYEMVKKTGGKGPGGCKGKKECDAFCENEANFPTCVDFAVANGLMPAEEAEMAKKTGGKGPGGCKGKEECDNFCNDEANFPTCVDFAVANGLMPAEEAEMAKKTGGKGPGGCKSKEACDAFCKNPDNQETCMNFAIEHGLMSEADLANMKKNQEFMNSGEGQCFMQCMNAAGVDSKNCGENGAGPEACKTCGEQCFPHDKTSGGRCLNQERWQQLDADCKAKGSGYHLEEVKGSNGQGGECVVDETCVYSSEKEWENQEEKERQLAEMQKQWDAERAQYEAEHGPGSQQDRSGGSGGGCTEPGPEGQCNPGPGAGPGPGPGPGSEGGGTGGGSGGDSGSSGGGDSGSSGSSGGSESSGGGESVPVTGAVITEINDNDWLLIIIKWIFRI